MSNSITLPEGYELHVRDESINIDTQKDSAWYTIGDTNWVASISYEAEEIAIYCCGEMRIELEDSTVRDFWDLMSAGIDTDEKLSKIPSEAWVNNSWFEIEDTINEEWYDGWISHNIDEAISMAVEALKQKIEDNGGRVTRRDERGELYLGDPA